MGVTEGTKKVRFVLGTVQQNRIYLFTELGNFATVEEAKLYWASVPRSAPAYVFREEDLYKFRVNYGTDLKMVATAPKGM